MPGIGDKLSAMFGGGNQSVTPAGNAPYPGPGMNPQAGQTMNSGNPSNPPPVAGPSNAYQVAYLQLVNQGVDPTEAAILAQEQVSQQGPSTAATTTAGLADVGNQLLQAKLYPELGRGIQPQPVSVSAPGPLALQSQPTPNPAITTASIIAELV